MSSPRILPSGDGASMRVMRGSTTPPNSVPFIRFTTNCVWRYAVMLLRERPEEVAVGVVRAGRRDT